MASTNDVAKALALEGEEEGTVVVAKTQLAGRGRMGRSWSSPPGGLYMSVVLRPEVSVGDMLLLTVLSSVPVAQAIEELTGLEAKLKWPNDIEVDGKKVGRHPGRVGVEERQPRSSWSSASASTSTPTRLSWKAGTRGLCPP